MKSKFNNRGGINPVILGLIFLVVIMLVVISIPLYKAYKYRSESIACQQAMKTAKDGLIIEYLNRQKTENIDEARNTLLEVMPGRDNICPAGGNVYLIMNSNGIYEPVCGIHYTNEPLRTRLNASYTFNVLTEARRKIIHGKSLSSGGKDKVTEPDSITVTVNSKKLKCVHVTKEESIHRGTATTNGYKGVVAFYGVAGDFTFSSKYEDKGNGTAADGDICYFVYADEDYCAIWRSNDGWSGDAYTTNVD